MIIIPKGAPNRSKRKLKSDELKYYEELEAQWRDQQPKCDFDELSLYMAKGELDRRLTRTFNRQKQNENESASEAALDAFFDARNSVPSPRWENELKHKFWRKNHSYKRMTDYWNNELQSEREVIEKANQLTVEQIKGRKWR